MPSARPLNAQLLPQVRELFESFLSQLSDSRATLCLVKGRMDGEAQEHWLFAAYGEEDIAELERLGRPFLYELEGFVVAIPQGVDELTGKIIGWADGHLLLESGQ